jgi:hypothetical protein
MVLDIGYVKQLAVSNPHRQERKKTMTYRERKRVTKARHASCMHEPCVKSAAGRLRSRQMTSQMLSRYDDRDAVTECRAFITRNRRTRADDHRPMGRFDFRSGQRTAGRQSRVLREPRRRRNSSEARCSRPRHRPPPTPVGRPDAACE